MISIVIPVFNSGSAMVRECHAALDGVLGTIAESAEVIYVDDGSSDDSLEALKALQRADDRVRVVELAANFGQHAAFSAGFDMVRGDVVVTMDVDLQTDPRDLPRLIAPLRQGHDFVSGVRTNRRDPLARRMASRVVTWLVASSTGVRLKDVGCPFNAFASDVAKSLSSFGELRRFLKPLAVRVAKSVAEVEVAHRPRARHHARTSYSSTRLLRLFMDFFVNSITDVFAWTFAGAVGLGAVLAVLTSAAVIAWGLGVAGPWPALAGVAGVITATLIAALGLVGDYVQRIHRQSTGRPYYLVKRVYETAPRTPVC